MAMLDSKRTVGEKRVPTQMRFKLMAFNDAAWEYVQEFRTLMWYIAKVNRCRGVIHPGFRQYDVTVVGMQEDVEWVQMLWMQVYLQFVSKIHPSWDLKDSIGANVAKFKEAGWKWEEIWKAGKMANTDIDTLMEYDPKGANYLMREYKRHLKATGQEQVGTQRFQAYRHSFVKSFVTAVSARLERMERDSKQQEDETSGSAVALLDVSERVEALFFDLFPSQRPLTDEELKRMRQEADRQAKEEHEKDQAFLASLSEKEREKVLAARAEEARKRAAADDKYWAREQERQARLYDDAGSRAGRNAAQEVNLSRATTSVPEHLRRAVEG
jgi:hypothetical protein